MIDRHYRIGEVAKLLGVEVSALRYWEAEFPKRIKPRRTSGGQRDYSSGDVAVFALIRELTRVEGYTLRGVRRIFAKGIVHKNALPEAAE